MTACYGITDGRMSGASGKVPAVIHLTPEAFGGGPLARVQDGDLVRLDAIAGTLDLRLAPIIFDSRSPAVQVAAPIGTGRELFAFMRHGADTAERGGSAMLAAAHL